MPLLQDALRPWRELESAAGRELLTLNGALMMGDPEQAEMDNVLCSIRNYGLQAELLTERQVAERYSQYRLTRDRSNSPESDTNIPHPR